MTVLLSSHRPVAPGARSASTSPTNSHAGKLPAGAPPAATGATNRGWGNQLDRLCSLSYGLARAQDMSA